MLTFLAVCSPAYARFAFVKGKAEGGNGQDQDSIETKSSSGVVPRWHQLDSCEDAPNRGQESRVARRGMEEYDEITGRRCGIGKSQRYSVSCEYGMWIINGCGDGRT